MLEERLKNILELVVREYIRTAEPVSSERVAQRMKNSLSSASIRNAFAELTHEGYIEQPHTSGGRIPRPRAYRFYVDELLSTDAHEAPLPRTLLGLIDRIEDMRLIQEEIARHMHVLSQFGSDMPIGFHEVFEEPEFAESTLRQQFGQFLDEFTEHKDRYARAVEPNTFTIFIGEENRIQPTPQLSLVVGKNDSNELFFIAGPTRMPYEHIIHFMKIWKKHPTTKRK